MISHPTSGRQPAASSSLDILVVDDDPTLRTMFTALLRMQGYAVDAAGDGQKALEFLADHRPRLIITDIFMPNGDGFELIMGLKQNWPESGVLAISGGGVGPPELFLKTARLIGRARTLPKPFLPEDLIAVVKEMLGGKAGAARSPVPCAGG